MGAAKRISTNPNTASANQGLWGEADKVLPPFLGEKLRQAIPNSRIEYIKFAGHIPQEEQPDAVISQIKTFLTE